MVSIKEISKVFLFSFCVCVCVCVCVKPNVRTVHKTSAHLTKYSSSAMNLLENGFDCSFCPIYFIAISLKV